MRTLASEPSRELRKDCQVGVQANAVKTPNPEREEGPLMLEKPGWEGNLLRCVFYTLLFSAIIWLAIILIVVAVTG